MFNSIRSNCLKNLTLSLVVILSTVSVSAASQGWDVINASFNSAREVAVNDLKPSQNLHCSGLYNPEIMAPAFAGTSPFRASLNLVKEGDTGGVTLMMIDDKGIDHKQGLMLLPSGLISISPMISRSWWGSYYNSKDIKTVIRTDGQKFFLQSTLKGWFSTSNIFALICSTN